MCVINGLVSQNGSDIGLNIGLCQLLLVVVIVSIDKLQNLQIAVHNCIIGLHHRC